MKRYIFFYLVTFVLFSILNAQSKNPDKFYNEIRLAINNNSDIERIDELITLKVDDLKAYKPDFNKNAFIIYHDKNEIPSQVYIKDNNSVILLVHDLPANDAVDFSIRYHESGNLLKNYKNRTYAELAMKFDAVYDSGKFVGDSFQNFDNVIVPEIHTDHDALFKYEGPGWESEKVGYRYYLDWRNVTDIFGKKVNELVLHKVGVNDLIAKDDSYHEMQDWGMDILKGGSNLGIGSIGTMSNDKIEMVSKTDQITCSITSNGPLLSEVTTDYEGWSIGENKVDITAKLSISAGSRITDADILIKGDMDNITTGIAKHEDTEFFQSESDENWQYIALYGKQALSGDKLGIVLFYEKASLKELGEDDYNHYVSIVPKEGRVKYKYAAAWEQESNGIKSFPEFKDYADKTLVKLNNPVIIEIK